MRLFEDNIQIEIPGRPTPSARSPEAEPSLDGKVNSVSRRDAVEAFFRLRLFMPERQKQIVATCMNGEERQYFFDKMVEIAATVEGMPVTYQQDGKGDEAIAHLHYFLGDCHWYITEKDRETPNPGVSWLWRACVRYLLSVPKRPTGCWIGSARTCCPGCLRTTFTSSSI